MSYLGLLYNDCVNVYYFTGRQIVPEDLLPNFLLKMVSTIKYLVALKVNWLKINRTCIVITIKVPITTAADNKFCDIFPNLEKKKGTIRYTLNIMPYLLFLKWVYPQGKTTKLFYCTRDLGLSSK